MKNLFVALFIMGLLGYGCATNQNADISSGDKRVYSMRHYGIFPGPDNAISAATAQVILEQGMAEAELTRTRTAQLKNVEGEIPDEDAYIDLTTKPSNPPKAGFDVRVFNTSEKLLKVGVDGNPDSKLIPVGMSNEFHVSGRVFKVYSYKFNDKGILVPYKDKEFKIGEPTPKIPIGGKLYAFQVIIQ